MFIKKKIFLTTMFIIVFIIDIWLVWKLTSSLMIKNIIVSMEILDNIL